MNRIGWVHAPLAMSLLLCLAPGCDAYDNDALARLKAELADAGKQQPMDSGPPPPNDSGPGNDEDAGGDGGTEPLSCHGGSCWWSKKNADGCDSAGRPTSADRPKAGSDAELPPIYLGTSRMRLGAFLPDGTQNDEAWTTFGVDLDGVCTNSTTCDGPRDQISCLSPTLELPFDGQDCRDNTFARLQPVAAMVPQVGQLFGLSEEVFNCALWRGDYTAVTKISGYNGERDDDQVRVDFYTSIGLENLEQGWSCPFKDFDKTYPLWRSTERWLINEADLADPVTGDGELPNSKTASIDAYVRDGYIVAFLPPDTVFRMAGERSLYPGFALVLQSALWLGKLERKQDSTWHLRDGLIAGAVKKDDLINSFRQIGLCPGGELDPFFVSVTDYVTENADVLSSGMSDPQLPCDAMSVGIYLEADPITPGATTPIAELVDCPPPPGLEDMDGGVP